VAKDEDQSDVRVTQARIDERLKSLEKKVEGTDKRIWGAVFLIVAYVVNQLLGLIGTGV
jgi:hypothetical protein